MNWNWLTFSALTLLLAAGCGRPKGEVLKVFHAGSLAVPFRELERAFEAENPGVDVQREAYGSATAIRQVTDLGKPADLVASADYQLIDSLMIESEPRWADWNVLFARNAMCIAYRDADNPITQANWTEALLSPGARVGMSDPNRDPCGYRSLFCVYLAESLLGRKGLFAGLVVANSNVALEQSGDGALIRAPANVAYRDRLVLRPKETDLVALLETGAIDYAFIYRSVATQHGLDFLALPDEVNLSRPDLAGEYGRVRVAQSADRAERTTQVVAGPIVYGVTIPSSARQPELAGRFIELILSERGRRIMEESGQRPLSPAVLSPASRMGTAPVSTSSQ